MINLRLRPARLQTPLPNAPFHTWTFPDGTLWTEFHRTNGGYLLRFPDLADFQVSADALAVTGFPAPEISETTVQHLYLNQVLPLVLSKLGKRVFTPAPSRSAMAPAPSLPSRVGASPRWRLVSRSTAFAS
jgi:hypothetical protein